MKKTGIHKYVDAFLHESPFTRTYVRVYNRIPGGVFVDKRIIIHIDVNSAYLSWEAVWRLQHGAEIDLRQVPSVIGGQEEKRNGIVLAKSIPAKKMGIKTGEVLWQARIKCPNLIVVHPNYGLYMQCSNALMDLISQYSPLMERYSIDECFVDVTEDLGKKSPIDLAMEVSRRVREELGFTVNIGISSNKLLAKMASEFEKPNKIHTLFTNEISSKLWSLPVKKLFMVGRRTAPKLNRLNIFTIGQLANVELQFLVDHFKSFGKVLWNYANGIDNSPVNPYGTIPKGLGNSLTTPFDVDNEEEAFLFLLSLTETAASRLRDIRLMARVISVSVRTNDFSFASHQRRLFSPTHITDILFKNVKMLFLELWRNDPLRHFGVTFSELCSDQFYQISVFDEERLSRKKALDSSIDSIRSRYGKTCLIRGSFIHSGIPPLSGGIIENYPSMRSQL